MRHSRRRNSLLYGSAAAKGSTNSPAPRPTSMCVGYPPNSSCGIRPVLSAASTLNGLHQKTRSSIARPPRAPDTFPSAPLGSLNSKASHSSSSQKQQASPAPVSTERGCLPPLVLVNHLKRERARVSSLRLLPGSACTIRRFLPPERRQARGKTRPQIKEAHDD